jgi:transcriptional regulator with XRE-family HTH domain
MDTRIIDTKDFGERIRRARKQQGATQKELAEFFSSFSREFLSDLENGKPTVELGRALAVAHALGLRVYLTADDALPKEGRS